MHSSCQTEKLKIRVRFHLRMEGSKAVLPWNLQHSPMERMQCLLGNFPSTSRRTIQYCRAPFSNEVGRPSRRPNGPARYRWVDLAHAQKLPASLLKHLAPSERAPAPHADGRPPAASVRIIWAGRPCKGRGDLFFRFRADHSRRRLRPQQRRLSAGLRRPLAESCPD